MGEGGEDESSLLNSPLKFVHMVTVPQQDVISRSGLSRLCFVFFIKKKKGGFGGEIITAV